MRGELRLMMVLSLGMAAAGCCQTGQGMSSPVESIAVGIAIVGRYIVRKGLQPFLPNRTRAPDDLGTNPDEDRFKPAAARHNAFFVYKRAKALSALHPDWKAEALSASDVSQTTLYARVEAEAGQVANFLTARIGTTEARKPYWGGSDPATPPHLELGVAQSANIDDGPLVGPFVTDVPESLGADNPTELQLRTIAAVDRRREQTTAIVWRAAAIHADLWDYSDPANPLLKQAALDKLLDRRLRFVEQVRYLLSTGALPGKWGPSAIGNRFWDALYIDGGGITHEYRQDDPTQQASGFLTTHASTATWTDRYVGRAIELPELPSNGHSQSDPDLDYFVYGLGDSVVTNLPTQSDDDRFNNDGTYSKKWHFARDRNVLEFNTGSGINPFNGNHEWMTGLRVPGRKADPGDALYMYEFWIAMPGYGSVTNEPWWVPKVGTGEYPTPSKMIAALTTPDADFLKRVWLYTDGAFSLAALEALMFTTWRHGSSQADFDTLLTNHPGHNAYPLGDPFQIRVSFDQWDTTIFGPTAGLFELAEIELQDLQVGDWVLPRNSAILFSSGRSWDLPMLTVTSIDSEHNETGLNVSTVQCQGFSGADQSFSAYQRTMVSEVERVLAGMRAQVAANPGPGPVRWQHLRYDPIRSENQSLSLRKWSPYGDTFSGATAEPWWYCIWFTQLAWATIFRDAANNVLSIDNVVRLLPYSLGVDTTSGGDWEFVTADPKFPAAAVRRIDINFPAYTPPPTGDYSLPSMPSPTDPKTWLFFPLWEPRAFGGGWANYLEGRRSSASPSDNQLDPMLVGGDLAASLTFGFANTATTRVLRPKTW